jgi:hypothetical protein
MFQRPTNQRGLQFLDRREHFLPIQSASLQARMLQDPRLSSSERRMLGKLFEMIAQRFHMEFRSRLEHVKAIYEPFDPDLDTQAVARRPTFDDQAQQRELARSFEQLLVSAKYQEMFHDRIVACTEFQANRNITVRASFDDYAELRVFYRGVRHETRTCRTWYSPWRSKEETVHVFARLALLVRLVKRQPEAVFLKLFKNVVAEDLEMLLPYVRIRMKLFDQLKIGTSVVGGMATASWKFWTAAVLSPWVLLAVGFGFAGTCVKGVTDFVASKTRYIHKLTTNLYFQNLANNSSMLAHVIDSAEAEQCKELLLAYFLLYVERNRDFTREQLDRRAEQWLAAEFGVTADFDVSAAVQKLVDKELVAQLPRPAAGRAGSTPLGPKASDPVAPADSMVLKVYDLPSSLRRLDEAWDECFEDNAIPLSGECRLADGDWPPFTENRRASAALDKKIPLA